MNRDYLIKKAKEIKENGNMLGIKVTIPEQDDLEIIINTNESIDNKIEYYCKTYDENLVHCNNDKIRIADVIEVSSILVKEENKVNMKLIDAFKELDTETIDTYDNEYECIVTVCEPSTEGELDSYDLFLKYILDNVEVVSLDKNYCECICNWSKFIKENMSVFKTLAKKYWNYDNDEDEEEFIYEWIVEIHMYLSGYTTDSIYQEILNLFTNKEE